MAELGWRVVNEYVSNPLASDSEDEKRIYKAEARATRKYKAEKSKKAKRSRSTPYGRQFPSKINNDQGSTTSQQTKRPPGLCFACGKPGHWKGSPECTVNTSNNKISINFETVSQKSMPHVEVSDINMISESRAFSDCKQVAQFTKSPINLSNRGENVKVVSPVGRLKNCLPKWQQATDSRYILDVVENGYKLPFKEIPSRVFLRNNKSAREIPTICL